jgi:TorA maturation chaperone TorD
MSARGPEEAVVVARDAGVFDHQIGGRETAASIQSQGSAGSVRSKEARTRSESAAFAADHTRPKEIDAVDAARAQEYGFLSILLAHAPDGALLERIVQLSGDATPLGLAHGALAQAAGSTSAEAVGREFFDLFVGVGRGELLPYGSYYLTGFLNERPLARLRDDLRRLGIERADGLTEPEDHAAILCEIMAGLAGGDFATSPDVQRKVFENHLAPWLGRFFADLERAEAADFYRHVGAVGRLFMEIETEAFTLPA